MWYVAYGSNLSSARFRTYLEGGRPPGRSKSHPGARDRSLWQRDAAVRVPHALFFSGNSRFWDGGGVAFLDPERSDVEVLARAYLITTEQFQDVMAQESGRTVGSDIDISVALEGGQAVVGSGMYDRVVGLGDKEGSPLVTFTTPLDAASMERNPPGRSYADTIASGLQECHGLTAAESSAYIRDWSRVDRR